MPTKKDINYSKLPFHMQEGMRAYLEIGRPTGDFLFYILSNNFVAAAYHADNINQHLLLSYCNFLYNEVPKEAWGKEETVWAWLKHRGFVGLEVTEGVEYAVGYWEDDEPAGMITVNYNCLKICFEYTPPTPYFNEETEVKVCIFKRIKVGIEVGIQVIYHWSPTSKAWFPGQPRKEQEKSQ